MELTYHSFNFSVLIEADVLVWAGVPISHKVGGTRAPPGGVAASTGLFNHLSWNIRSFKLRRLVTCSWWRYLNKVGTWANSQVSQILPFAWAYSPHDIQGVPPRFKIICRTIRFFHNCQITVTPLRCEPTCSSGFIIFWRS